MKHNITKWGLIFTLTLALIFSSTCFAFATTVGDQLTSPETGWQRFNSNDYTYFHYYGDYAAGGNPLCYQGDYVLFYNGGVNFKFSGTKIRIIACLYSGDSVDSYSNKINITIDGGTAHQINETFSEAANTNGVQTYLNMVYEKAGLNNGVHTVTLSSPGYRTPAPEVHTVLDAVDIDDTGSMIPYNTPTSLNAILDIRMDDGSTKEYRLTSDELSDFLTWYESRSRGESKAFYIFKVKGDVSPFSSVDNYIPFDKILSYDVKSYS